MRKLKFYLLGLIPGLVLVFFILNKKGASCAYFPNSRVTAETLTKQFTYTPEFQQEMKSSKIDEKFLRDSIISKGEIDFEKSHAQKTCPDYLLNYPKKNSRFQIRFEKCKDGARFLKLKPLR